MIAKRLLDDAAHGHLRLLRAERLAAGYGARNVREHNDITHASSGPFFFTRAICIIALRLSRHVGAQYSKRLAHHGLVFLADIAHTLAAHSENQVHTVVLRIRENRFKVSQKAG